MIQSIFRSGVFALAALSATLPAANAEQLDETLSKIVSAELLQGWRTDSGTHMAALHISLADGWKTYWRAPGDAGIPPRFDWNGSRNLAAVQFHWPRPDVFETNGARTIGYMSDVVIPIELTPTKMGTEISLKGIMELGVCDEICVPATLSFEALLSAKGGQSNPAIHNAIADRPMTSGQAKVASVRCDVEPIADGLRLTATITMPSLAKNEIAVFELRDQSIWISQVDVERKGQELTAVAEMVPPSNSPFSLDRSDVRITVLGTDKAVDIQGCTAG